MRPPEIFAPPPEIFDRTARRLRRDQQRGRRPSLFEGVFAETLLDRMDSVTRRFSRALIIGANPVLVAGVKDRGIRFDIIDPAPGRAAMLHGRSMDEDRIVADQPLYDLVIAAGTLDTVADLPGALILARRQLVPDGVFLASLFGAPSLPALRHAVASADARAGLAIQRIHPQIDARAAGDLLQRTGFALPVADIDLLQLAYRSFDALIGDLRAAAATNVLAERQPVDRGWIAAAQRAFEGAAGPDGRTIEQIAILNLTGWAPSPTQPLPARRGSATASLAKALGDQQRD